MFLISSARSSRSRIYAATRLSFGRTRSKRDGTRAETRLSLSAKWTSPFKLAGAPVQSTTGSRGVRISVNNGSNVGYTMFWGRVQDYWLPTPLACFPFTSPTVRHRVPSGFNWALFPADCQQLLQFLFLWFRNKDSRTLQCNLSNLSTSLV